MGRSAGLVKSVAHVSLKLAVRASKIVVTRKELMGTKTSEGKQIRQDMAFSERFKSRASDYCTTPV